MSPSSPTPHPWIVALQAGLDQLEKALLRGDATGVEQASAVVQGVLQHAPKTVELAAPGGLRTDMLQAAQRFGQLRQAVLRGHAQSQRAVNSLLPQQQPATYGAPSARPSPTGGAGRAYLSA